MTVRTATCRMASKIDLSKAGTRMVTQPSNHEIDRDIFEQFPEMGLDFQKSLTALQKESADGTPGLDS